MSTNSQPDLDDVLYALSTIADNKKNVSVIEEKPRSTEEIHDKLMEILLEQIEKNREMLDKTKDSYDQLGEADHAKAYSEVAKINADIMKHLTTLVTEKEKNKVNKELRNRDMDIKERIADNKVGPKKLEQTNTTNNTFYITANRETLFDSLWGNDAQKEKAISRIKEQNEIIDSVIVEEPTEELTT